MNDFDKMEAYRKMTEFFTETLNCSRQDVEELFDPNNGINVADTFRAIVENTGELPDRNDIYVEAVHEFCYEHGLEYGEDVEIKANSWADTTIEIRKGLDPDIVKEMEDKFNMEFDVDILERDGESKNKANKNIEKD